MIQILEKERTFHLQTCCTSLILYAADSGHLMQLYWGSRLEDEEFSYIVKDIKKASYLCGTDGNNQFRLEQYPIVYPVWGCPDLRLPAFLAEYPDGSRITDLRFSGYRLFRGKGKIEGFPTVSDPLAEGMELILDDPVMKVRVHLIYGVFESCDAITQRVEIENYGTGFIRIERVMSASFSFLENDFDALTLTGAWARECELTVQPVRQGVFQTGSTRGASGHGQNPFFALAESGTSEKSGKVWAVNLVYSGSFEADVEVDMHQNTRMMIGIQSQGFSWKLEAGETFYAPEAVMVFSDEGLGRMSRSYHRLYRKYLMQNVWAERLRPIVVNNWEATYFDFNREILVELASTAKKLGAELFVLDDGWFGKRNSDSCSLGDWTENREKLGGSLKDLAEEICSMGMEFGIWMEPEMVSPDSELYRTHPDWVIRTPGHKPQLARNQLVLDLSRREVQDYVIDAVDRVLRDAPISYLKWDMNRNITEWYSEGLSADRQTELGHRYILGLYRVLENITRAHPQVLFEGCAGGGGRFDPGMLYYMPQIWASDDTDGIERLNIQYGTSLIYPAISMTAHISACPNHMTGRNTSLTQRAVTAMAGNLGYELNLNLLSVDEQEKIKQQILFYKQYREVIQKGELYRLMRKGNQWAWMYISEDGNQAVVSFVQVLNHANTVPKRLKLEGLEPEMDYEVRRVWPKCGDPLIRRGRALMQIGLALDRPNGDFYGEQWVVRRL